jgi:hypothetical protein
MKTVRNLFLFLVTAVLATLALPVLGASQPSAGTYDMTITVTGPLTLKVVLSNVTSNTPGKGANNNNNNATITSFSITFANAQPASGAGIDAETTTPKKNTVFSASGNTLYVSSFSPLKPNAGQLAFTITLKDCGDNLTLTGAVASTSNGALPGGSGLPFTPDAAAMAALGATYSVVCGQIGCATPSTQIPKSSYVAFVTRGAFDKDGAQTVPEGCVPVDYTVSDLSGGQTHFFWPTTTDDAAAFLYKFNVNTPSLPPKQVAWLGAPDYIPGPACLLRPTSLPTDDAVLPAPYGNLKAYLTEAAVIATPAPPTPDGKGYLEVDTTGAQIARAVAGTNFDVIIGSTTGNERLTVKYDNSGTYMPTHAGAEIWLIVARQVGGTPMSSLTPVVPVMYTPLPLLPGISPLDRVTPLATNGSYPGTYQTGMQAQMCVVNINNVAGGYTTFIDIGDGFHQP